MLKIHVSLSFSKHLLKGSTSLASHLLSPPPQLLPLVGNFLTLARHLSGFVWAGALQHLCDTPSCTECAPGLGPVQGSTGPSAVARMASIRGQLAAGLCCSWNLSRAHVPALAAVPGTWDLCAAALQGLLSPLILSDI